MTEQNVQSLPTDRPRAVGTSQVSIRSSADKLSDFSEARAILEVAEAKLAYVRAQKALSSGSQTGSVGRRLDDVRSDEGSSGPSRPIREQARDSPFAGIFPPPLTRTPTTTPYTDYYSNPDDLRSILGKQRYGYLGTNVIECSFSAFWIPTAVWQWTFGAN